MEGLQSVVEGTREVGPLCSVVVRAFNEEAHIGRLLTGIARQSLLPIEVVVVDSGSTDRTASIALENGARLVSIAPEDFSFGRALNLGCAAATGEFVVVASAHVYPVYPDWIARLLAPFEEPDVGLVYGKQRGAAATHFSERQVFAAWYPDEPVSRQEHPFCNNANAAIRRDLWRDRPYDESLPALEDLEWASWAMHQGWQLAYAAEAEVVHVHNERYRQIYNRYRREAMALKRIRPAEHFNLSDFARLLLTNVASDSRHAWADGVLREVLGDVLRFRLAQFWGTYRGFRLSGPLTDQLKRTFYYPRGYQPRPPTAARAVPPIDYEVPVWKEDDVRS
jgi:glycosyltransferase involved in cell wall biosynthesis